MLHFFRQITFEPHLLYEALAQFRIKRMFGLAQIFSFLSCGALPRHLQSTVKGFDYIDFSPSTGSGIEMTKRISAKSNNP